MEINEIRDVVLGKLQNLYIESWNGEYALEFNPPNVSITDCSMSIELENIWVTPTDRPMSFTFENAKLMWDDHESNSISGSGSLEFLDGDILIKNFSISEYIDFYTAGEEYEDLME